MQEKSYDIPLHDIKPIVEVQEYSFYYFLGVIALAAIVIFALLYLLFKWYKKRNAFNIRKEHFRLLGELDLSDTKKAAYAITLYGFTFKDDSPRHVEMYENITARLDMYKYKKSVDEFDSETLGYIDLYRGMIDV
jgi:hypothetical protein